jgi:hypothetical protein
MTEDYMRTFTSLGEVLKSAGRGRWGHDEGDEIGRQIKEKISRKLREANEEEK